MSLFGRRRNAERELEVVEVLEAAAANNIRTAELLTRYAERLKAEAEDRAGQRRRAHDDADDA
jgi:hypothetical protein